MDSLAIAQQFVANQVVFALRTYEFTGDIDEPPYNGFQWTIKWPGQAFTHRSISDTLDEAYEDAYHYYIHHQ